ncbi:unnamed protein product [Pieris macdunnoughi]|uniref:Uncharacterized protein n=1 Tax=Pieris macdunnoughi TaxID=345717 RepID=A0A821MZS5_9NEOP|nr:unnamed protein product [Pieris macdunnoughi]
MLFFKKRKIIVLAVFIAVVARAAVPSKNREAKILRYDVDNIGLGNYRYAYEQTDGTGQKQEGVITNEGREDEAIVKGYFSWRAPDDMLYTVTYTSGVEGYKPTLEVFRIGIKKGQALKVISATLNSHALVSLLG